MPKLTSAGSVALNNRSEISQNTNKISNFEQRIQTVESSIYNPWLSLNPEQNQAFLDSHLVVHERNSNLKVPIRVILNFTSPYAVVKELTIAKHSELDSTSTDAEIAEKIKEDLVAEYGANYLVYQDTVDNGTEHDPDNVSILIKDFTKYKFIVTRGKPQFRGSDAPFSKICEWRLDQLDTNNRSYSTVLSGSIDTTNDKKFLVEDSGHFYLPNGIQKNNTSEYIRVGYPCNIKYLLLEDLDYVHVFTSTGVTALTGVTVTSGSIFEDLSVSDQNKLITGYSSQSQNVILNEWISKSYVTKTKVNEDLRNALFSWGREDTFWEDNLAGFMVPGINFKFDALGTKIEKIYTNSPYDTIEQIKAEPDATSILATNIELFGLNGGQTSGVFPVDIDTLFFFAGVTFDTDSNGDLDKTKILIPPGTIYNYYTTTKFGEISGEYSNAGDGILSNFTLKVASNEFIPNSLSFFDHGQYAPMNYLFLKKID